MANHPEPPKPLAHVHNETILFPCHCRNCGQTYAQHARFHMWGDLGEYPMCQDGSVNTFSVEL